MRGKPRKGGNEAKKADFGVNKSEFWSNENFKREQAAYDEGAINLFAPSLNDEFFRSNTLYLTG